MHCICQNQACEKNVFCHSSKIISNFLGLTQECLDHSSWFKHKSTLFCSIHGIGVIGLLKLHIRKTKTFLAHSVARVGEGSHFITPYMRMLRATCAASSYPRSRCHVTAPHLWHNFSPRPRHDLDNSAVDITCISHEVWSMEGHKCSQELLYTNI